MKIEYEFKFIDLIEGEYRVIVNYEETVIKCKFCNSTALVKNGHRKGIQYWTCKECGKSFVNDNALPKMKYPINIIADAVYDYYSGVSLNKIRKGIDQKANLSPSTSTIYEWVKRLTNIGINEANNYKPEVGKKWVMDETVIWLNGKKYWYIVAIDSLTRYILGTKVSHNRNKKDIQSVLEDATKKTSIIPDIVLSDATLLKSIIITIDRFGLKARFLRKHKIHAEHFFKNLCKQEYQTEVTVKWKKRFEKNRNKLFTFLDYDNIPWNNNNAEHAIKAVALLRR